MKLVGSGVQKIEALGSDKASKAIRSLYNSETQLEYYVRDFSWETKHTHTSRHACTHAHSHTCMCMQHAHTHTQCMHTHIHTYARIHAHSHTHACIHILYTPPTHPRKGNHDRLKSMTAPKINLVN